MLEELHHPWLKRLFLGFARTSESNGPAMPNGSPHPLIQEIDVELPVAQPVFHLTHKIFGSCPPMQNFDPAKLLTVQKLIFSPVFQLLYCQQQSFSHRLPTPEFLGALEILSKLMITLWKIVIIKLKGMGQKQKGL